MRSQTVPSGQRLRNGTAVNGAEMNATEAAVALNGPDDMWGHPHNLS
ncbi:hypothetical protein [Novipirellula caenicola]